MVTAKFGSKQFKVTSKMICTPNDFATSESIDIEETERSGKKPSTKVKGIKLQTASFSVLLDARFVNVATEIQWWKNTLRAKSPKDLYFGNYKIGKFYLTQVDVAEANINKNGTYTKAKLSLSFTEYGGSGTSSTNSKSSSSSSRSSNSSASRVKASASTKTKAKKLQRGSVVKAKGGTRMYATYKEAIHKRGSSAKAPTSSSTVTNIISEGGKVVAVQAFGGKWMRVEDVTIIKY